MRRMAVVVASLLLVLAPLGAEAQDSKAALETVSKAMGADVVTSIVYTGEGILYAVGQSQTPGAAWPRFNVKSYMRSINYDTASYRDDFFITQAENPPRGGGIQPVRGERSQT